ncbi:MAG: hypothetical protein ACJAY8_000089 [Sphingobacteriales bacterium]|jgi:uncharacterized protein (DUF2132 family)
MHSRVWRLRPTGLLEPTRFMEEQKNNPLHGIKLANLLEELVEKYGWEGLGYRVNIRCFTDNPSLKSSLTFLRKTPWAREKVEKLYLQMKGL